MAHATATQPQTFESTQRLPEYTRDHRCDFIDMRGANYCQNKAEFAVRLDSPDHDLIACADCAKWTLDNASYFNRVLITTLSNTPPRR